MTTINERILFIIKQFCDDNQAEFARRMGEKPQTVSGWLKRSNGKRVLDKILFKFPEINPTWFLFGEGDFIKNESVEESQPLKNENKQELQAVPLNPNAIINVPLVNQYAYAGYLNGYQNETYMNTFATIARNKLKFDKSTVGEALNHIEKDSKITDIYIQKDFTIINEVNKKVIEYVFKKYVV